MPCWELFEAQDDAYRATVLPPGEARVAVEAALRFGWDRYLGERGGFVGMTGYGARTRSTNSSASRRQRSWPAKRCLGR